MYVPARKLIAVLGAVWLLAACSLLPDPKPAAQDRYLLEYTPAMAVAGSEDMPVLMITTPRAHGAYDTARIAYMQQQFGLRYYVRSRWADTPARMLAPLLAEAMNATGQFQALYASPGALSAQLRLDTELLRFHQDFTAQPSMIHVTLRAQLVDLKDQHVIASRLFDIREAATSEDTYGGVQAANRATAQLMEQLSRFCLESSR
ncbi:MAG: ABC-type transport auxiliary lipoprotein family protein [Gammaproteobacteria bacterium]|nr:ABC-type transport auxiliary lipoprotein family protein [Gammaproteobacteria bacterium]